MTCLGVNLANTNRVYEQYPVLTREIEENLNKWRDTLHMDWKNQHVKAFLPKLIYRFNAFLSKSQQ